MIYKFYILPMIQEIEAFFPPSCGGRKIDVVVSCVGRDKEFFGAAVRFVKFFAEARGRCLVFFRDEDGDASVIFFKRFARVVVIFEKFSYRENRVSMRRNIRQITKRRNEKYSCNFFGHVRGNLRGNGGAKRFADEIEGRLVFCAE